jgi:hypothetical protein
MFRSAVGKNAPALDAKEAGFRAIRRQIAQANWAGDAGERRAARPADRLRDPDVASNILVNCAALH